MCAQTSQGVQIQWQGSGEGFTFTGFHLCDLTLVQDHTTNQLNIVMPLTQHPFSRFTHNGESFGKEVIKGLTLFYSLFKGNGLCCKFRIAQRKEILLQIICP
jgi:hypothetical protein